MAKKSSISQEIRLINKQKKALKALLDKSCEVIEEIEELKEVFLFFDLIFDEIIEKNHKQIDFTEFSNICSLLKVFKYNLCEPKSLLLEEKARELDKQRVRCSSLLD